MSVNIHMHEAFGHEMLHTHIYRSLKWFQEAASRANLVSPLQLTGEDWHPKWVGMQPFFLQLKHPIHDGLGSGESMGILLICRSYMIFIPVICLSDTFLFVLLWCYNPLFCWLLRRKKNRTLKFRIFTRMGITRKTHPPKRSTFLGWKKWHPNGRRVGLFGQLSPLKRPSNATPMKRRRKKSFVISCWGHNG